MDHEVKDYRFIQSRFICPNAITRRDGKGRETSPSHLETLNFDDLHTFPGRKGSVMCKQHHTGGKT